MEDDRTISDIREMDFDDLLDEIDTPSPTEIVAVAVYYLKVVEDNRGWIRQQQIRDTLASSDYPEAKVSIDHVHTELRKLDDFGYLRYSPSGGVKISASGSMWFKSLLRGDHSYGFFSEEWKGLSEAPFEDLRREIERCYHANAHTAVVVLSRKLLENLLVELLRIRYGLEKSTERELFYDAGRKRFQSFAILIENFENNLDDFLPFSERLDEDTVEKLDNVRETGNASAHSIEVDVSTDELDEFREDVNKVLEDLTAVRQGLRSAN